MMHVFRSGRSLIRPSGIRKIISRSHQIEIIPILIYNSQFGRLPPIDYIVPSTPVWPSKYWGFELGIHHKNVLDTYFKVHYGYMNLELVSILKSTNIPALTLYEGLKQYHSLNNNIDVPQDFFIPRSEPWDPILWGLHLGRQFRANYFLPGFSEYRVKLERAGILFSEKREEMADDRIIDAFRRFMDLYKQSYVPIHFIVPESEEWPKDMHGMELGKIFYDINDRLAHCIQRNTIKSMGFKFRYSKMFKTFYTLLQLYREKYGHVEVPKSFVVPSNDPWWPEHGWGFRLGATVVNVRYKVTLVHHHEELEAMGIRIGRSSPLFEAALKTFQSLYGHIMIPKDFVVPSDDSQWPLGVWRLELGSLLHQSLRIKKNTTPPFGMETLQAVGIHVPSLQQHYNTLYDMMIQAKIVYRKRGFGSFPVEESFVFPAENDDQIPPALRGFPYGKEYHQLWRHNKFYYTTTQFNSMKIPLSDREAVVSSLSQGKPEALELKEDQNEIKKD